ncbi:MAG: hypothetical protein IJY42_02120 [Clostridia bacterium]|nr:hypothetical protein [Clostridia bacterium]
MNDGRESWERISEKRRETRKQVERGFLNGESEGLRFHDLMLGALVLIAAVISFTEFTFSLGSLRNLTALTVFLYVVTMFVYRNRYERGKRRGRKDGEYKAVLEGYRTKRQMIYDRGLAGRIPAFCTYYKKKELREYRESLLCDIDMDYEEYKSRYLRMSEKDLMKQPLSAESKRILLKCNRARSVKLLPGMLLNENGEYDRHKLIGQSGRERERRDKRQDAVSRGVFVLFGAVVAVDVIFHFEVITVIQWIVRMLPVVVAIITGEDGGFCNITVTETAFKQNQTAVLSLFEDWAGENPSPSES